MRKIALAATLALVLGGHPQARVMEILPERGPVSSGPAAGPPEGVAILQSASSDLAEPEMFAMMLLGLVLIGYRVRRGGSEKFK